MGGGTRNYSKMPRNLPTGNLSKHMYFPCLDKKDTCAQIVSRLYEHVVHWHLLAVKSVRNKYTFRSDKIDRFVFPRNNQKNFCEYSVWKAP